MQTPIRDFARAYADSGMSRLHMPGHKGVGPLGIEAFDITEIAGADELYDAEGIIAQSERNAADLFGTGATFYSCEGSSLCVRAMLYLAMTNRRDRASRPVVLAGRNAHKALLYAAVLCDFDIEWLYPEAASPVCACPLTAQKVACAIDAMGERPFCVYLTSPDYLGGMQDIRGMADACHARGVPLIVDNAHGAYLKFLKPSLHPIDLGADLCCDSAHKTLPVLTGGAYLHISKHADPAYIEGARAAMAMFGSTSPSYLILQSLDACNAWLEAGFPEALRRTAERVAELKHTLASRGFELPSCEPVKLTLRGDGGSIARALRQAGVEPEYVDRAHVVLMFAPDNPGSDYRRIEDALVDASEYACPAEAQTAMTRPPRAMTVREAVFAPSETVPAAEAEGRICAAPTVSCPPAVPVAVSGEIVTASAVRALIRNGIGHIRVVKTP